MTTHKFHRGYNPRLPPSSARRGRVLPKISKKKKKKHKKQKKKFANKEKALKFVREKSSKRNKKKKADYPRLIREYEKAKKNGSVAKWAEENDIKNRLLVASGNFKTGS